jgi:hypothetical protein
VEIVLTGAKLPPDQTLGTSPTSPGNLRFVTADPDGVFAAASSPTARVQVVIVDADTYGVQLVRDMHTVFPSLRLIALSDDPRIRRTMKKAGATLVLPSSTPPAALSTLAAKLARKR